MHFELYKDQKKEWRWRLVARNGRTIADSAEGYKRPGQARQAVDRIKTHVRKNIPVQTE